MEPLINDTPPRKIISICDLPDEILLQIFRYYLETENQSKLLEVIYNVCPSWKNLCYDSSLWHIYDGSLPFTVMMKLCNDGCFKNTRTFKLSKYNDMSDETSKRLFAGLKNVKAVDFSNLKQISKNILQEMGNNCLEVCDIQFGKLDDYESTKNKKLLKYDTLSSYLTLRGSCLLSINLSYCFVKTLITIIRAIADCCPNLEILNLACVGECIGTVFPTEYIQKRCPKLKVLHIDHFMRLSQTKHSEGFPNLEVFSFYNPYYDLILDNYYNPYCDVIYDKELRCILFNSLRLKTLNLTRCRMSSNFLLALPASDLQVLKISSSDAANSDNLHEVMKKWHHSLKHVDISYSSCDCLDRAITSLISTSASSQLEELNVSFTKITPDIVGKILEKCNKLHMLRLESCRNLGRGMKQSFIGVNQLKVLEGKVKSFMRAG